MWLYDANVEYFKGKHLYLGMWILVFIVLPKALCSVFDHLPAIASLFGSQALPVGQQVKACLFDAYAGPYKDNLDRNATTSSHAANQTHWIGHICHIYIYIYIMVVSSALLIAQSNGI